MKEYKVLKGWHYCCNFFPYIKLKSEIYTGLKYFVYENKLVKFTEDSKYDIDEPSAVNKLFGLCYGLFGVHKNSDRLGWRYNKETDLFDIYMYSYVDGVLYKECITSVKSGEMYYYSLEVTFSDDMNKRNVVINFAPYCEPCKIIKEVTYTANHRFCLIAELGLYFGGNTPAPKTIKVKII